MGGGGYSFSSRAARAVNAGYHTKAIHEVFESRSLNSLMSPADLKFRESCDSEEHPLTVPIIIGLDVTGSMLDVPHYLIKDGLPHLVSKIMEAGIKDPQILFTAIGDHRSDNVPFQIGQFESSDELLDKWLTTVFLEGNGGGNGGESYHLAWYAAANHTKIDAFDKRGKKGFLFTIGDEPCHATLNKDSLKVMFGGEQQDQTAKDLLANAQKMYHVYHLFITETGTGHNYKGSNNWANLIGENLIYVDKKEDVSSIIARKIIEITSHQDTEKVQYIPIPSNEPNNSIDNSSTNKPDKITL